MFKTAKKALIDLEALHVLHLLLPAIFLVSPTRADAADKAAAEAKRILQTTKSSEGLLVYVGSGDGELSAALGSSGSYVVHGLAADREDLQEARDYVRGRGLYGTISFDRRGNKLPYIDNLVNLLVVEDSGGIDKSEMMRVLAPGGRLYDLATATMEAKPPMDGIDDWTHFMHDSTGNAVANDTVVSPPKYLKWVTGSRWSRAHHFMGSVPGLVAGQGRIFAIVEDGFVGKDQMNAAQRWSLIARDAYNGVLLWRRPIKAFHSAFWRLKAGPVQLPERLVTDGKRVFATMAINGPVSAMDAATGDLIMEYQGIAGTEEILFNDGVLLLLRNPLREGGQHQEPIRTDINGFKGSSPHPENEKEVMAVDAMTGKTHWKKKSVVLVTTLAADGKHVYFYDGTRIVCLDRTSGEQKWETPPVARLKPVPAKSTPELVVSKETVLFIGGLRFEGGSRKDKTAKKTSAKRRGRQRQ